MRTCRQATYFIQNLVKTKSYIPVIIVDESVLDFIVTAPEEYAIKLADSSNQKLKLRGEVNYKKYLSVFLASFQEMMGIHFR